MIGFGGLMTAVAALGMFVCLILLLVGATHLGFGGGDEVAILDFHIRLCVATGLSCTTFIGGILFLVHGLDRPDSDAAPAAKQAQPDPP